MSYRSEHAAHAAFDANRCTYWHPERDGEPQVRCPARASERDSVGDRCERHARPAVNIEATGLELLAQRFAFKLHGRREEGRPLDYLYADDARTIIDAARGLDFVQMREAINSLPVAFETRPTTLRELMVHLERVSSAIHQLRMDRASLLEDLDATVLALRAAGFQVADRAPLRFAVARIANALADLARKTPPYSAPDGTPYVCVNSMGTENYVQVERGTLEVLLELALEES